MKSLKERLAERAKRDERKRLKRSLDRLSYLNIKVPKLSKYVEGDEIYIKVRVKTIIQQIKMRSSWDVFTEFCKQIGEINKQIEIEEAANAERVRQWELQTGGAPVNVPVDPIPTQRQPRRPRRGRPPVRGNRRPHQRGNFRQILANYRLPEIPVVTPVALTP